MKKFIIIIAAMVAATLSAGSAFAVRGNDNPGDPENNGQGGPPVNNGGNGGQGGQGVVTSGFGNHVLSPTAIATQGQQQGQGQLQGQLQGQVQGQQQGNTQGLTLQQSYSADPGRNNTPSIGMGSLYPSSPCMGTSNVGGSGPGFSIGFGTSWVDEECQKMEASRNAPTPGDRVFVWCKSKFAEGSPSCPKPAAAPAVKTTQAPVEIAKQAPKPKATDDRTATTTPVSFNAGNCPAGMEQDAILAARGVTACYPK